MKPRERALEIVSALQTAGHTALWAGGCVRDALLNKQPKDYDVATSATPDEVEAVFGANKTLAIGKSFGVITVLGPKSAGPVEVATFRRDGDYSDGRRPDSVEFTDAKEDALRRDFTINGMFFDPVAEKVIDYVGGQEDLKAKQIRAIGKAKERIDEDKLRMLRAVRFAATYEFAIEAETLSAIQENANQISAVSPERIGNELRRMLSHRNKATAFELLVESGLWSEIGPSQSQRPDPVERDQLRGSLDRLQSDDFSVVVAALCQRDDGLPEKLKSVWRLTNDEVEKAQWLLKALPVIEQAQGLAWSQLQPWLISKHADEGVQLVEALAPGEFDASLARCRESLTLKPETLNPPLLLDGKSLVAMGVQPGRHFKRLIDQARAMQLDGTLSTREQATEWANRALAEGGDESDAAN